MTALEALVLSANFPNSAAVDSAHRAHRCEFRIVLCHSDLPPIAARQYGQLEPPPWNWISVLETDAPQL